MVQKTGSGQSDTDPEQYDLLASLYARNSMVAFNPFGLVALGCPYFIVITDSEGSPLGKINNLLPANKAIPGPDAWVYVGHKRVIGRVFTRHRDFSRVDRSGLPAESVHPAYKLDLMMMGDDLEPVPDPLRLREGEYFLYLWSPRDWKASVYSPAATAEFRVHN